MGGKINIQMETWIDGQINMKYENINRLMERQMEKQMDWWKEDEWIERQTERKDKKKN